MPHKRKTSRTNKKPRSNILQILASKSRSFTPRKLSAQHKAKLHAGRGKGHRSPRSSIIAKHRTHRRRNTLRSRQLSKPQISAKRRAFLRRSISKQRMKSYLTQRAQLFGHNRSTHKRLHPLGKARKIYVELMPGRTLHHNGKAIVVRWKPTGSTFKSRTPGGAAKKAIRGRNGGTVYLIHRIPNKLRKQLGESNKNDSKYRGSIFEYHVEQKALPQGKQHSFVGANGKTITLKHKAVITRRIRHPYRRRIAGGRMISSDLVKENQITVVRKGRRSHKRGPKRTKKSKKSKKSKRSRSRSRSRSPKAPVVGQQSPKKRKGSRKGRKKRSRAPKAGPYQTVAPYHIAGLQGTSSKSPIVMHIRKPRKGRKGSRKGKGRKKDVIHRTKKGTSPRGQLIRRKSRQIQRKKRWQAATRQSGPGPVVSPSTKALYQSMFHKKKKRTSKGKGKKKSHKTTGKRQMKALGLA